MYLNVLSQKEKECFWVLAKALAKADGIISFEEERYLDQYLKEMELTSETIKVLELTVYDAIEHLAKCENNIKRKIYVELIALALCNNEYDEKEKLLMKKIQNSFLISDTQKESIINLVTDIFDAYYKLEVIINE